MTAAALTAVAIHHVWPGLRADAFTGTFLIVAVLPWLAPLLRTVKLPGGFEVELRELRDELAETQGEVRSAAIQAPVGAAAATGAPLAEAVAHGSPSAAPPPAASADGPAGTAALLALGGTYERERDARRPSAARTEGMTRVVAEMLRVARALRPGAVDVGALVSSQARGERLAGIGYAHEHPVYAYAEPLVQALSGGEDTPFGQYWALRALRRVAALGDGFPVQLCGLLVAYRDRQRPATDRYYEVSQLLRETRCGGGGASRGADDRP